MKTRIEQAGFAALNGHIAQLSVLLSQGVDTKSTGLWRSAIGSTKSKEALELLIKLGRPTLPELGEYLAIAVIANRPRAIDTIAEAMIDPEKPATWKSTAEIIKRYDPARAGIWLTGAITRHRKCDH